MTLAPMDTSRCRTVGSLGDEPRGRSPFGARFLLLIVVAVMALAALAPPALAHPLGNFTVNHLTYVKISADRIDLLYILDEAEIPTFREQQLGFSRSELLKNRSAYVHRRLALLVDGRRVALEPRSGVKLSFPPGQAGLKTTRLELPFVARVAEPRRVQFQDLTFERTLGLTDIVARPGRATTVRTKVPRAEPTNGLRTYRGTVLKEAPQKRLGTFHVKPGPGTLIAPGGRKAVDGDAGGDGFANVFEDAAAGEGLFLVLLLAAFGWGALHALSPGHGKAMVAAYLVGTRGTARHALALGGIVTVTHTIGVFALGLVTLVLAQYILPEDLYPWLNLASGLLILGVGLGVLRSRIRWARQQRAAHDRHHHHDHDHGHDHGHGHNHIPDPTWKGLAGMGVSAGIIPCPTALVVLLAAISQNQIALGLLLIVVFSVGLASTLTALGLGVVYAKRLASRVSSSLSFSSRVVATLPAASTLLILGLGIALTARAIPDLM
jgi:nickel/cobalt exporter